MFFFYNSLQVSTQEVSNRRKLWNTAYKTKLMDTCFRKTDLFLTQ